MKLRYKIALMIALLGVLYYIFHKLDLERFYGHFSNINLVYVGYAFASMLLYFLIWNYRWKISLFKIARTRFVKLLPILMAGAFVNNITPGAGTGGEARHHVAGADRGAALVGAVPRGAVAGRAHQFHR